MKEYTEEDIKLVAEVLGLTTSIPCEGYHEGLPITRVINVDTGLYEYWKFNPYRIQEYLLSPKGEREIVNYLYNQGCVEILFCRCDKLLEDIVDVDKNWRVGVFWYGEFGKAIRATADTREEALLECMLNYCKNYKKKNES